MSWKVIKRRDNKVYVKWKKADSSINSWIDKKIYCNIKWVFFPEPYTHSVKKIKVELDFSN